MVNVLFVCLGNICRSPTAEGIFRQIVVRAGLDNKIKIDSAGTAGYHIGAPPDRRAQATAILRGIDLSGLRGRKAITEDFERFHYVLAMDRDNYYDLQRICPKGAESRLRLFLDFSPRRGIKDVPDPFHGKNEDFEQVFTLIEETAHSLLDYIRRTDLSERS